MRKQFFRVKQIADQTFLRAEKTEVLTEDLLNAEKRVDTIKQSCQLTGKKIASCHIDFGSEVSSEKKLRKIPQVLLATSMQENGNCFSSNSVLGTVLQECAPVQAKLGNELLEYYNEVEKSILKPIVSILENEMHSISKLRKQLAKLTLDMDSARTRFQTAERHINQTAAGTSAINSTAKLDILKDEMEEASQKVDQCRDALAAEMFSLIAKEPQISQLYLQLHHLQAAYHRNALSALETSIPHLESLVSNYSQKPVYGCPLEEHLRVTSRNVAQVIETCIDFLLEYGLAEEGLLRIAGSASKLKRLKSAFDAGLEIDMAEYVRDPHAVSGALKSYLRELPEPLMTYALYEEWMNAAKISEFESRLQALWQVAHKLPEQNFCNLQYVIKFLSKLHENVDINKMTSQNIAIVVAPNLIWSPVEDVNSTFGMNMSTANLHSSIVETLISYADWFFPDSEFSFNLKLSNNNSELVQDNATGHDVEENANLPPTDLNPSGIAQSPKVFPRNVKKPAAPAPPVQRISVKEKAPDGLAPLVTPDLMDLNSDTESTADPEDIVLRHKVSAIPPSAVSSERPEIVSRTSVVRRRSNEHVTNAEYPPVAKQEKPFVPEKPASYSTYSLDRKSRPVSLSSTSSRSTDRLPDIVQRSHVERPSVPPPERPAKPSRFSSIDMSSNSEKYKPIGKSSFSEQAGSEILSNAKSADSLSSPFVEANELSDETVKVEISSPSQAHSRVKQNRFDFLVTQTTEKPPERPPRSVPSAPDLTELETSQELLFNQGKEIECQQHPRSPTSDSSGMRTANLDEASSEVSSVSKQSIPDTEKQKPPRPQPPMPLSKPKISNIIENTSL